MMPNSQDATPRRFAYCGAFLEQFGQLRRSLISNQFCFAVRAGANTAEDVLSWVAQDARHRIADRFANEDARDLQRQLLATLEYSEAAEFAEFILRREKLSPKAKRQLRAKDGRPYVERHMAELPPTEKQISLLQKLGVDVTPGNRLEASQAIDSLLHHEEAHR